MEKGILPRVGTFVILVGCGLLLLFGGSIAAGDYGFGVLYLLFAAISMFLGTSLRRTAARPEPTRFSSIRQARDRSRQRREEKQAQKDQNK
jgi:hypothetical protein